MSFNLVSMYRIKVLGTADLLRAGGFNHCFGSCRIDFKKCLGKVNEILKGTKPRKAKPFDYLQ